MLISRLFASMTLVYIDADCLVHNCVVLIVTSQRSAAVDHTNDEKNLGTRELNVIIYYVITCNNANGVMASNQTFSQYLSILLNFPIMILYCLCIG